MLELKKDFVRSIENCQWFNNCGNKDTVLEFDCVYINSLEELRRHIQSQKWSNLTLEKQNDFTSFLFFNYQEWYSQKWNSTVVDIKNNYIFPLFDDKVKCFDDVKLQKAILSDVQWNVLSLFMLNIFSEYYQDAFFEKMQKIYLAGHLPCGWDGTLKEGKFLVY